MPVIQKVRCQVDQIIDHGDHVYAVGLRPERAVPRFHPGQFLHLALDEYDPSGFWPDSRPFSIANSPEQRDYLSIAYSVQGRFTARMEHDLWVGKTVWVKLPYGEFVVENATDVVLMAGGTGITAFTAFLAALGPELDHPVTLFYGARQKSLLIYRDILECQSNIVKDLRVIYFLERGDIEPGEKLGRLSIQAIWPAIDRPHQTNFYLSGPPAMLKALSTDLRGQGISDAFIHIDAWT